MPLHRHHLVSPLPNEPSPVLRCAACQAAHSFRPCRSTRLRRFPPHHAPQVCCTLQPVMGFAVFRPSLVRPRSHATDAKHLLYGACPSKPFPRQQPYRVTAAVPFPPLDGTRPTSELASRSHRLPPRPQGLAPLTKPLRTLRRCQQSVARCFHGLLVLGRALARPAAPKSHGCLVSGEPATRASRSPTGEPEGRQPPSPMVPIDSAERSRRTRLRRVRFAERRADTEVPPVLEGMM